jgi:hypothetical protein
VASCPAAAGWLSSRLSLARSASPLGHPAASHTPASMGKIATIHHNYNSHDNNCKTSKGCARIIRWHPRQYALRVARWAEVSKLLLMLLMAWWFVTIQRRATCLESGWHRDGKSHPITITTLIITVTMLILTKLQALVLAKLCKNSQMTL